MIEADLSQLDDLGERMIAADKRGDMVALVNLFQQYLDEMCRLLGPENAWEIVQEQVQKICPQHSETLH